MAYQHYNGRQHESRHQYDDFVQTRRPSQHSVTFTDLHQDFAQPDCITQHKPHRGHAAYGHNTQTRYSNIDHGRYNIHRGSPDHLEQGGYASSFSTSDYISPPVESRHDYILPQHSTTQQHTSQERQTYENRRDCGEYDRNLRHHRYFEPRSSARAVYADKSNYQRLKESGFDSKHEHMHAYGIKPRNIDAYDQANDVVDSFRHVDAHNQRSQNSRSQPEHAPTYRPRSSRHRYTSPARHATSLRDSDVESWIDSNIPEREYMGDSGSDIASYKSDTLQERYWSRSPSVNKYRSVSRSPARRWRDTSKNEERDYNSDSDHDTPRHRFVSASPRSRSRRYSSTLLRSRSRSRRNASVGVRSSGSSVLSYRSVRSNLGRDFEGECGGRSGSDSGSESVLSVESSSESDSAESMDGWDDDYLDDGWDERIEDGSEDDGTEYED
ncbi:hypothetical protein DE146DRAFT_173541 [Phaeosphaeria sp. MPI-PUGE-AT-0046c]|nr:hypothetical protein DE146DRAFT_173541 [Phaeosphaeria sp. MPI-PUGE-AT-0046c]